MSSREPDGADLTASIATWMADAIENGSTPAQILQPLTVAIGSAVAIFAESSARPGHETTVIAQVCGAILHRARAAHTAGITGPSSKMEH